MENNLEPVDQLKKEVANLFQGFLKDYPELADKIDTTNYDNLFRFVAWSTFKERNKEEIGEKRILIWEAVRDSFKKDIENLDLLIDSFKKNVLKLNFCLSTEEEKMLSDEKNLRIFIKALVLTNPYQLGWFLADLLPVNHCTFRTTYQVKEEMQKEEITHDPAA